MKSFLPNDGSGDPPEDGGHNPAVDFRGEGRTNDIRASTTDPEARPARNGPGWEASLCYLEHLMMENRIGSAGDVIVIQATCTAERKTAAHMLAMRHVMQLLTADALKSCVARACASTHPQCT